MERSDAVVVLESVSYAYNAEKRVLKDISLEAFEGERVLVLGHNGSGKSTLVKILGALQTPSQGVCFVCGCDTADESSQACLHKKIGVVFQDPESQIVGGVVEDDVAFAPENQGAASSEIERRISEALKKVGLERKRKAAVSALSGGEKQRLALAGVLAAEGVCLILDEPTAMLDPEGCRNIEEAFRGIHDAGTTILQVTHQLGDVERADRVLVLKDGKWAWGGRPRDFWDVAEGLGFELPALHLLKKRLETSGIPVDSASVESLAEALEKSGRKPLRQTETNLPAEQSPFFEIRSLSYSCNPGTPLETAILDKISFAVPEKSWTSILGKTGSGKSTLVQHLNGLYPVQSGMVLMKGAPLPTSGPELRDLRRKVGLVFQSPEDQLFSATVFEELSFAPHNWGFSEETTEKNIVWAMESVGLSEDFLRRNPLSLSGGERRLVAIASVLVSDPECIVFDEPTAGLDAEFRKRILALLVSLKEAGKTIVTVTHDLDMALGLSDCLLMLDKGKCFYGGRTDEGLSSLLRFLPRHAWPDILLLSDELRRRGLDVPMTWDVDTLCRVFGLQAIF